MWEENRAALCTYLLELNVTKINCYERSWRYKHAKCLNSESKEMGWKYKQHFAI